MRLILLIEDNPADVLLMRHALNQAGVAHDLQVLSDGDEVLEYIERHSSYGELLPDLVLLDLNLPKRDGSELLAALRAQPVFSSVPIVVITSSFSPDDHERIAQMGVRGYISKPVDLSGYARVGETIRNVLEG